MEYPKSSRRPNRSTLPWAMGACAAVAASLAVIAAPGAQAAVQHRQARPVELANGDFAQPNQATGYASVAAKDAVPGWKLIGSGVDVYSATLCNREDDQQCLDLNNQYTPGGLGQDLHATPGDRVRVTFETTRSMYGSCFNFGPNGGAVPFHVKVDGQQVGRVSPDARATATPAKWQRFTVAFRATKSIHHLTFESADRTQGTCGAMLANVHATETP